MLPDNFLTGVKHSESEADRSSTTQPTKDTDMTDVPIEHQESEETPINLYLKKSYNQLLRLAAEAEEDGDDVDFLKKYHEKHFKVFKQQKMPLIGGGGHHNVSQSNTIVLPGS